MHLAGHMCGKAASEYALLSTDDKQTFASTVQALRTCLDPGRCTLAAQDFSNAFSMIKKLCQITSPDWSSRFK